MDEKNVITQDPDLTMETDASMLGWGAVCQASRTGGLWFQTEWRCHINYLELLAAWFRVRAFAKDKRNIQRNNYNSLTSDIFQVILLNVRPLIRYLSNAMHGCLIKLRDNTSIDRYYMIISEIL